MRRPDLMVYPADAGPYAAVAYCEISREGGRHVLLIPRGYAERPLRYALYADLHELGTEFHPDNSTFAPARQ